MAAIALQAERDGRDLSPIARFAIYDLAKPKIDEISRGTELKELIGADLLSARLSITSGEYADAA